MKYREIIESSIPLSGLAAKYVAMGEAEAARVVWDHFGIEGNVKRFASEKNDTFGISSIDGRRFILKAANPAEDVSEIDLQIRVLEHLAVAAPDIPVPRVIENRRGEPQFRHRDDAGQHRHVWIMSYLAGKPLGEVQTTPLARQEIGKVLARLRLALADFRHPAESRVIPWDIKHLPKLSNLVGEVEEPGRRRQLDDGLARFEHIEGRLAKSRMQLLHNDFNGSNVIVDPTLPAFVSGVIDFGDAVRTSIAIDVATALSTLLPKEARDRDLFSGGRDLLNGYLAVADLTEEELRLIPYLAMGRVVAKIRLSTWLANSVPENAAYFLRSTGQCWHQLEWFLKNSEAEMSDQFTNLVA